MTTPGPARRDAKEPVELIEEVAHAAQGMGEDGEWVVRRDRRMVDSKGTSHLELTGRHNARGGWKEVNPADVVVLLDAAHAEGDGVRLTALTLP